MNRPVRTGVPPRVTSVTSTTPRAVVTSIRRPAREATISKVWTPPPPVSTTASTRSPFIRSIRPPSGRSNASVARQEPGEPERQPERDQADVHVEADRCQGEADDRDDEEDVGDAP